MFLKSSLQAVSNLRTIWQQKQPARCLIHAKDGAFEMQDLKNTFARNATTLPGDFAAVAALIVIVFAGLSLPNFF